MIETPTARTWLEGGILRVQQAPGSEQTYDDACRNVAASIAVANGQRLPMLVDMSQVRSITREARARYASPKNSETITALALVVGSPLSRMIGNFFIGLNKAPVPTRLFDSTDGALGWLEQYRGGA